MVCLAPRAPEDSVRPRRLSGVVVRPLNFTVRRPVTVLYTLLLAYVVVLTAVAVAGWLFTKRLTPKQLNRWLPRLRLINLLIICAFVVSVAVYVRVWFLAVPLLGVVLLYPYVRNVRVCETCGTVVEPFRFKAVAFCSACGAPLRSSSLFRGRSAA